jgi:hypothetical protein
MNEYTDPVIRMCPRFAITLGSAGLMVRTTPRRSTSMTRSYLANGVVTIVAGGSLAMPALANTTSSRPKRARVDVTTEAIASASVTSAASASRGGPRTPAHLWDGLHRDLRAEVQNARQVALAEQQADRER